MHKYSVCPEFIKSTASLDLTDSSIDYASAVQSIKCKPYSSIKRHKSPSKKRSLVFLLSKKYKIKRYDN